MESKKLQQLQQANSHLAPQPMPLKNAPPSFHSSTGDYRPTLHSPVFQNNSPQYRSVTSQFSQLNLSTGGSQHHQQQYSIQSPQSSSGGSQSIPIDTAPSQSHHSLLMKSAQNAYNQQKQQQQHQQQLYDSQYSSSSGALTEQLYQSPSDKMYPMSMPASSSTRNPFQSPTMSYSGHPNPAISFQQQYQQLQQAKMQAQIQTQNEALVQQQRTFALRQQLNPPIPHYHLHSQSQSLASIPMQAGLQQQHEQQQHSPIQTAHRNNPPSTLNLSSQYQPAQKPLKLTNFEKQQQQEVHPRDSHYHQEISMMENKLQQEQQYVSKLMNQNYCHQQGQHYSESMQQQNKTYQEKFDTGTPSDHGPVYIQQNHPGHVVNQACQTQISGTSGSSKTKMSPESDQQQHQQNQRSPIHQQLDRKKSSGSIQALKSPITKRPASSPVTLSGWLYKQGSDGLKVWRKRWFVLSEYCLYYYKGPEEEKVLGSILLPSYKVTSCLPEDKIYRKYAFKCEHTNMRTYWLAAENSEQMCQWVRALTAAAMMQGSSESDQTSQPSVSSLNHSGENSDSGIHTFQSQQSKMGALLQGPVTPASDNGNLNNMGIGLGGCVVNNNAANFNNNTSGAQPLYANAPPKPRRINDGGYSSPSPENSIDRCDPNTESRHHLSSQYVKQPPIKSPSIPAQMKSQHHAIYDTRTGNVTSTLKHPNDSLPSSYHKQDQLNYDRNLTVSACLAQTRPPYQSSNDLLMRAGSQHFDEDLYGERELYGQQLKQQQSQRDLIMQKKYPSSHHIPGSSGYPGIASERRTPDAYGRSKSEQIQSPFSDYEDIYNLSQNKMQQQSDVCGYRRPISPQTYNNEKHVPPMPSHYNPNNLESSSTNPQVNMRTRSLQSSNLIRPHSADFLEYEARAEAAAAAVANVRSDSMRAPRPKSSLDINRAPDSYYYSEASYAEKMRQSASYLQKPQNQQQGLSTNNHRSSSNILNSSNNSGTLQDLNIYSTSGMYTIGHDTAYERMRHSESGGLTTTDQSAFSVPRMSRSHSKDFRLRQQQQQQQHQQSDQFLRSASARWPRKDEEALLKDGEKKREESMKRLLEWKQRMLQSPLTRKGAASQQYQQNLSISKLALSTNAPGGSASNLLSPYVGGGIQRSRSETHANIATGYNSYSSDDEASISVQNVHNLPRTNLSIKPLVVGDSLENDQDHQGMMVSKVTDKMRTSSYYGNEAGSSLRGALGNRTLTEMDIRSNYNHDDYSYPPMMRKSGSRAEIDLLERETNSQIRNLDVSAGDLLSRTHEELVLLLIQLRRQNSTTARAIEQCCTEIHELQNRIRTMGGPSRSESIQRLDYLKQHLLDLERQYEKSKPLVNLVDNMVKLGSLYRNNENSASRYLQQNESVTLDRLEFNQRIQERRLLKEEQRHWDRVSPDHTELQSKVRQLYQLDQLLQEESGTLQNLQRDKEDLERALGGLKARLQDSNSHPVQMEAAKKQQHILERELSRVHQLLAENSKKLEQTVAGNARLEQELLVLRQKLQASRGSRGSQGVLSPSGGNMQNSNGGGDSITFASSTTALLESELKRVQQLVGDMQRQRQELSHAVRQLTENSNALYQQIGKNRELYTSYSSTTPLSSTTAVSTTPSSSTAGVNNSSVLGASHSKKRQNHPCWTETDLDSMISITHTKDNLIGNHNINTPLFVDTGSANSSANILNCSSSTNMNEYDTTSSKRNYNRYDAQDNLESRDSDNINIGGSLDNMDVDTMENNQFSNLSSQERQEIKTVRIVKRESERRQRDRERSMISSTQNLDQVQEEDVASSMSTNNKTIPDQRYNEQEQNGGYNRSKSQPRTYDSDSYDIYRQSFEKKMYNDYYQTSNVKSSNNSNPINSNSATHRYGIDDYGTTHSFYGSTGTNSSPTTTNPYPVTMSDNNSNITSAYSNYASVIKSKHPNPTTLSTNPFEQPQHVAQTAVYSSLKQKSDSIQSLTSPIFQSEAAKQIISEMSAGSASEDNTEKVPLAHKHRRAVPKEKRRHYTAPNNVNATAMENVQAENDMNRNNTNWKARDDLDMEIALRPRMNAPDIVKSALGQREKISENTIDKLLAAPSKILIPERYIPEKAPELSPEEKKRRQEKVESIKKMLSEAPMNTSNDTANLPSSKLNAEKKQREHLLQLNQILAQQVMQMSKIVAGNPSQSNNNNNKNNNNSEK